MFEMLWWAQQSPMSQAPADAACARHRAADASIRIRQLEADVDRLLLINRALWELVRAQHGLEDSHLVDKVKELDLRDGRLDGKLTAHQTQRCQRCGRTLSRKHPRCIYCGGESFQTDAFETVR
ncbi:MAG: hypothetical protein KA354_03295 [Phycisphaerae bacterium]|nr:hypothetical protein [Phycisphaerae bacterium]